MTPVVRLKPRRTSLLLLIATALGLLGVALSTQPPSGIFKLGDPVLRITVGTISVLLAVTSTLALVSAFRRDFSVVAAIDDDRVWIARYLAHPHFWIPWLSAGAIYAVGHGAATMRTTLDSEPIAILRISLRLPGGTITSAFPASLVEDGYRERWASFQRNRIE